MRKIDRLIAGFDQKWGRKVLHAMFFGSLAVAVPCWLFFDHVPAWITLASTCTAFGGLIGEVAELSGPCCCRDCPDIYTDPAFHDIEGNIWHEDR